MPELEQNPVAIPRELESLKERQVWGLFEYPDKVNRPHEKAPLKLGPPHNRIQSCTKWQECYTYAQAVEYMTQWPDRFELSLSLRLANACFDQIIKVVDVDPYKDDFDQSNLPAMLDMDTFIDVSPSGKGYHLWFFFNVEPTGAKKVSGIDHISGWITMSGKVYKDVPMEVVELPEQALQANGKYSELSLVNGTMISAAYLYNLLHPIEDELEACGFREIGRRWLSPGSGTNNPGGVVFPSNNNPYDLFYTSNETGLEWMPRDEVTGNKKAIDAFELFAHREFGGNKSAAAKACTKQLPHVDPATGELDYSRCMQDASNELQLAAKERYPVISEDQIDTTERTEDFTGILAVEKLPHDVLAPADHFGDLVRAIDSSRHQPNMMTAFIAALGTISFLGGGKISGASKKDRLRIYALGVGETSCGKGTIVEAPSEIATAVMASGSSGNDPTRNIFGSFASPEGLEDALVLSPDLLFTWDEFGKALVEANADNGSRLAQLLKYLLEIWPIPHQIKHQRPRADRIGAQIWAPHPVVIGASTENRLAEGINLDFINDGLAARFLMWPVTAYRAELPKRAPDMEIPEQVLSNLTTIWNTQGDYTMDSLKCRVENPFRITWDDEVADYFHSISFAHKKLPAGSLQSALSGRKIINVKAIAMSRALINNPAEPVVSIEHAKWANRLVDQSIFYQYRLFREKAFSSPTDAAEKAVLARLKRSAGRYIKAKVLCDLSTMRKLNPAMRWSVIGQVVSVVDEVEQAVSKNARGKESFSYKYEEL